MRVTPLITATIVAAALYGLVFERDAILAFAQVSGDRAEATETEDDAMRPPAVKVVAMTSEARLVETGVVLRGRTEAARTVEVRAETSGQVISEPLRKGAEVAAGDILCELDPGTRMATLAEAQGRLQEARARLPEARARIPEAEARVPEAEARLAEARANAATAEARLAEAQARLEEARINLNAALQLEQEGFASETRVANARAAFESAQAGVVAARAGLESARAAISGAEAGVESAKAQVEAARAGVESALAGIESAEAAVASAERELERLTIEAPFSGILETDAAELGTLLQPGSPCATVIRLDPIKLVGFVPEADVDRVTVGARVGARLATGREVLGTVTFVGRSADPTTRTFRVEAEVPNPDLSIRDNQTVEMLVETEGRPAHLIPQSALTLDDEGALGVRTIVDGKAHFVPVTVVRDTIEGIWVTGLPEKAEIITVGQEFVTEGTAVEGVFADAGAASETESDT